MKEETLGLFAEKLGGVPDVVVRAPGRVNLIGEHTDYNDGFVMPLAVERATWIGLRPWNKKGARLYSREFDEWGEAAPDASALDGAGHSWKCYFQGVTAGILNRYPDASGWEGVSLSDLPIGAGLSSSASFELGVARAFATVSDIPWRPMEMALLCHRAEADSAGVNCGTMDQLAVALGRKEHALLIDCRSFETKAIPLPRGCAIVILDTGKARTLAGSAYNERREQCEKAARLLDAPSLRDVTAEAFQKAEGKMSALLAKRARHVVTENERTREAAAAMEANDRAALGRLMNASHESLRGDYEVSCRELNWIVEAARAEKGCFGARMTGAGFGGCAVALVDQDAIEPFLSGVKERYRQVAGIEAKLYVTGAADGTNADPANTAV